MEPPEHPIRESDDLLREQSWLVARGVRSLALVGHCDAEPLVMLRAATRLESLADADVLPYVLDRGDGRASYGYAAAPWAVDLLEWVEMSGAVPEEQRHRILGLLLGYSPSEIAKHEATHGGRRFAEPRSPVRVAS